MTRHIAPIIARATRPGINGEPRPAKFLSEDGWRVVMALSIQEIKLKMKVHYQWREAMEVGLLNSVFADPPDFKIANEIMHEPPVDFHKGRPYPVHSQMPPAPAKPAPASSPAPAPPSFNTDYAWDMVILAARASRYE